jgi:hypothetical protein
MLFPLRAVEAYRDRCEDVQEILGVANELSSSSPTAGQTWRNRRALWSYGVSTGAKRRWTAQGCAEASPHGACVLVLAGQDLLGTIIRGASRAAIRLAAFPAVDRLPDWELVRSPAAGVRRSDRRQDHAEDR